MIDNYVSYLQKNYTKETMDLCPLTLYMRQTPCLEAFILAALDVHPDLNLWDSSHLGGLVKSGYLCFPFSLYRRL